MASVEQTGWIQGRLGVRLFTRWWPAPEPRGVLVFVHGFGEHSGRYLHVFEHFTSVGWSCFGFDYRGHGRADGRRAYINNYAEYVSDLDAALARARDLAPEGPLYVVGHSQGGLIVTRALIDGPRAIDGFVLSSPFLGLKVKVAAWKDRVGKVAASLWPTLSIPSDMDPSHVSRDPAVVDAYTSDPLVLKSVTARWFQESLAAHERVARDARTITAPALVLQAMDDRIADPAATRRVYESLGSPDKTFIPYRGLYHEIFNEPEAPQVFADVDAWLRERTS